MIDRNLSGSALVSGGASGLGAATVRHLRDLGVPVVIADRDGEKGAALAKELGDGVTFVKANVTDAAEVELAVATAVGLSGDGLRLSVSCAGIDALQRLIGRQGLHSIEAFERVIRVHLLGTFIQLRAAVAVMAENEPLHGERGLHISTASIAAFDGDHGQIAYASAKAGIAGMVLPAARDLGRVQIRINAIAPGIFDTPMVQAEGGMIDQILPRIAFPKRLGDPAEFAYAVESIARNRMCNATILRLDGGIRL